MSRNPTFILIFAVAAAPTLHAGDVSSTSAPKTSGQLTKRKSIGIPDTSTRSAAAHCAEVTTNAVIHTSVLPKTALKLRAKPQWIRSLRPDVSHRPAAHRQDEYASYHC